MKLPLIIILSVAATLLCQTEHAEALDLSKMLSCIDMGYIQNATLLCQRQFYKSLKDDPSQNCSALAMTMLPSCLNDTIVDCVLNAMGVNITMIPANTIPSTANFVSDPAVFCENIVPVILEPVINCSLDYYLAQAMCVLPFQRKFIANKADPGLCSAYAVQMNCLRSSMDANCEATEMKTMTTKYSYLFETDGNPFYFDNNTECSAGNNTGTGVVVPIDFSKIGSCIEMGFIQKSATNCLREFYKSFRSDPNQNCTATAMRMLPSCINSSTVTCVLDKMGIDINMLPPGSIPSTSGFISDPQMFCDNITPVMIEPVTNCSFGHFVGQLACILPFQLRFKANKADNGLCSAYSVQMSCLKTSMMNHCEVQAVQNLTTNYSYLFEREGNPFYFGDDSDCSAGSNLVAQSILIAFCLFFMSFLM